MNMTIDCKAVSRLLSDALEQNPTPEDRERLRLHFGVCETCRNVEQQMSVLHRAMQLIDKESHDR